MNQHCLELHLVSMVCQVQMSFTNMLLEVVVYSLILELIYCITKKRLSNCVFICEYIENLRPKHRKSKYKIKENM